METSSPRAFRDPIVLEDRLRRLDEPHVARLNNWVRHLRAQLGPEAIVPWFDPADGGSNARILWLLEAPGPKSTRERGGSGIISCDNNDGTAENTWRTRQEAHVSRADVVHWNVIPYYIGADKKIRAWERDDVMNAGPILAELMRDLPQVRSVILGGRAAQEAWRDHGPSTPTVRTFPCPHPSATNVNTRPSTWPEVVAAWRAAGQWATA